MGTYEIVAVLRPDLDEEGLTAAIERVTQRIVENRGTVQTIERWGKRRTAYPIQKYRDGVYVLTVFALDPQQIAPLRQTLGLNEDLLRFTVSTHHPSPAPAPKAAPAAHSIGQAAQPAAAASNGPGGGIGQAAAASSESAGATGQSAAAPVSAVEERTPPASAERSHV
jgi:small subunit ribosomal protein S6